MSKSHSTGSSVESNGEIPLLAAEGVSKSFGGVQALQDVEISVARGEVVGLVGDNGAGKSTLVNVLSGNLRPDSATIQFKGEEVDIHQPSDADDLGIRVVYQDLALCDNLDIVDNLFLGQEITGSALLARRVKRFSEEARAREVLDRVNLGDIALNRPVRNLSGGQRQNIAIARTLLYDPEVVILDEPTSALSVNAAGDVGDLVQQLAAEGIGVIVVSHDIHKFVMNVVDRLVVLRLGQNVANLQTNEVTPEQVVNAMVGGESNGGQES